MENTGVGPDDDAERADEPEEEQVDLVGEVNWGLRLPVWGTCYAGALQGHPVCAMRVFQWG